MKTLLTTTALLSSLALAQAWELHEWGTFTTVSGSDGELLTGLQREEESLPTYVHHHLGFVSQPYFHDRTGNRLNIMMKRTPLPVRNVKVKMETPVIYFHSPEPLDVSLKVGFEGGTISQWYPQRSGGEKVTGTGHPFDQGKRILDFAKPYRGSIEWQVEVLSPAESRRTPVFKSGDNAQWTHARVPEANVVRNHDGETEGFLFYRGIGSFEPGLVTRVSEDETLHLENRTGGRIPYVLVYERQEDGTTSWHEPGPLESDGSASISATALQPREPGFDTELFFTLSENLAAQGLLRSESEAMVKTWWKSYFEAPGLRVFWVLPESKTDAILPLEVNPAPKKTVRVIVGRSEVLRPSQERAWLAQSASKDKEEAMKWLNLSSSDRFGEAYAQRIATLKSQAKKD